MIQVGEVSALAAVEDSAAANGEGTVRADGEARLEKGVSLQWAVELELLVGDDLTLSVILVGKDTILQNDDGSVGACLSLLESLSASFDEVSLADSASDIDGADLEGTREVLGAARWSLCRDRGREGEESYGVLHGVSECGSRGRCRVNKRVLIMIKAKLRLSMQQEANDLWTVERK